MDKLVSSFSQSLFERDVIDAGIDILEVGIDTVLDQGLLSEIPIVKTVIGIGKLVQNVHDRNLLKQTLVFIHEFNDGSISIDKLRHHQDLINSNPRKAEAELGRVLIILNRFTDNRKAKFLARIYKAYINEIISWDDFTEFTEMIDMMLDSDIQTLFDSYKQKGIYDVTLISRKHDRLLSIGLMKNVFRQTGDYYFKPDGIDNPLLMDLTDVGYQFCDIIFR